MCFLARFVNITFLYVSCIGSTSTNATRPMNIVHLKRWAEGSASISDIIYATKDDIVEYMGFIGFGDLEIPFYPSG